MNPAYIFSTASPKSVRFEIPSGKGIDPKEIFAELAGLNGNSYYYGLAKYANDNQSIQRLYKEIESIAQSIASKRRWRINSLQTLHSAARLSLDLTLYPQLSYCRRCQGSGSSSMGVICRTCQGNGHRSISNQSIADLLQVNESAIRKTWNKRINLLTNIITQWESAIYKHLARKTELMNNPT